MYFSPLLIVSCLDLGLIPDLTNDHKIKGTLATVIGLHSQVHVTNTSFIMWSDFMHTLLTKGCF